MFLIILTQALFALTFPLGKLALEVSTAPFLIGVRMLLGGSVLLLYAIWRNRKEFSRVVQDRGLFAKTALFYIYLAFMAEFFALSKISATKVNLLWSAAPFVAALLSYYLLKERLTRKKWLGLVVGLIGMIPIIWVADAQEVGLPEFLHVSYPELLMVIAVVSNAYAWFLVKQLLAKGYSLSLINGITMLLGGGMCLITQWVTCPTGVLGCSDIEKTLLYAMALVLVANVTAYPLHGYLLRFYSITLLSFSGFLCPVFGLFLNKLILHETITAQHIVALLFVFIGLYLFYRDEMYNTSVT